MAENSKIEWTDHTFNPWQGCTKVSPGCTNCYAEARDKRWHKGSHWGKGAPRLLKKDWNDPVRWNNAAAPYMSAWPRPPRVFCASLADWLDDEVPIEWLARLLKLIHDTPNLDWLLLTKRPQNWHSRIDAAGDWHFDHGDRNTTGWLCDWWKHKIAPKNVWLGTTVEDQKRAAERIPELLAIPAHVRFLSVEPMLERVHFTTSAFPSEESFRRGIHWAIFGGESGPGARPCNIEWIRDGVRQCKAAGVAPFVKQLGAKIECRNDAGFDGDQGEWPMDTQYVELDTGYQGAPVRVQLKDKKGGDWSEWPEDLRIREFPSVRA